MVALERGQKRREQLDKAAEALCAQFTEVFRPLGFSWFHKTHGDHATLSAQQSLQEHLPPEKATDILLGILSECGLTPPKAFRWPHKMGAISLKDDDSESLTISMRLTSGALERLTQSISWINEALSARVPVRVEERAHPSSLFKRGNAHHLQF